MHKRFLPVLLIVFLIVSQNVLGQSFSLNGSGARAAGMGYAFTGIADDATAISWNPAGLTQLYEMEASVIGRIGFGSGSLNWPENTVYRQLFIDDYYDEYNNDYIIELTQQRQQIDSWDFEKESAFQLNFISLVVPLSLGKFNVVGGIAYRTMYDFTNKITQTRNGQLTQNWHNWNFGTLNFPNDPAVEDSGLTNFGDTEIISSDITTGGIAAISPSLGFQINEMLSVGTTFNILTGSDETESTFEWDSELEGKGSNDSDPVTTDYSGLAIDVGVLLKPSEKFQIGANLGLPHTIKWEDDDDEGELSVPLFFSIGAGFRATDELTLAFDYRSRPWSKAENEDGDEIEMLKEDANSIHVGMEYLANLGDNFLPIRLGFYTEPLPVQDANEDQISNNVFTGGIGIIMGSIIIDGSFEWSMSSYSRFKTTDNNDIDFDGNDFRISFGTVIHFNK